MYKSSNPALCSDTFTNAAPFGTYSDTMTIRGTVNKTAFLGLLVLLAAMATWHLFTTGQALFAPFMIGGAIAGFVVALVVIFKKTTAPYLAPVYAVCEGLFLGGISAFMESMYPGIVLQAIVLTLGTLFSLLLIYRMGIIQATENFKLIVASATAGIAIFYLISLVSRFFGFNMPLIHDNSTAGIVFSLLVVAIAALNLVIDFDFIEHGAENNAPKYMEWYAAFGLMVTIIWLYIEILRLLAKMRSND